MRKQFYLNQFPVPEPKIDRFDLISEFNIKYSHFELTYLTEEWYQHRIDDAVNAWYDQKNSITDEYFDTALMGKMQKASVLWIKERAFRNMLIDSIEGELFNQARAGIGYSTPDTDNAKQYFNDILQHKLNELKSERDSYENKFFNFGRFMTRQARQMDDLLAEPMEAIG